MAFVSRAKHLAHGIFDWQMSAQLCVSVYLSYSHITPK